MITRQEYEHLTAKQWIGKKVRTRTDLSNGWCRIPSGTVCTIIAKSGGFSLESAPCKCCGVSIHISKVPPRDVTLWEASPNEEATQ